MDFAAPGNSISRSTPSDAPAIDSSARFTRSAHHDPDQICASPDAELLDHTGAMILDCSWTYPKDASTLLAGRPSHEQLQHIEFSIAEQLSAWEMNQFERLRHFGLSAS